MTDLRECLGQGNRISELETVEGTEIRKSRQIFG